MLHQLIEAGFVLGVIGLFFALRTYVSKRNIGINVEAAPNQPEILAGFIGLGAAVIAAQVTGAIPALLGLAYKYVVEVKVTAVILYSAINGAVGVAVLKRFGSVHTRWFVVLSTFFYFDVFALLVGWALYQNEKAGMIGKLWTKLVYFFYITVGTSVRNGLALIVCFAEIFLGLWCGILSAHVKVPSLSEKDTSSIPWTIHPALSGLVTGLFLALSAQLQVWIRTPYSGYTSQLFEIIGGAAQAVLTGLVAVASVVFANTLENAQDWHWRAFLSSAMGAVYWGISHMFGSSPDGTSTHDFLLAKFLTASLRAIVFFAGFGTVSWLTATVFVHRYVSSGYRRIGETSA